MSSWSGKQESLSWVPSKLLVLRSLLISGQRGQEASGDAGECDQREMKRRPRSNRDCDKTKISPDFDLNQSNLQNLSLVEHFKAAKFEPQLSMLLAMNVSD